MDYVLTTAASVSCDHPPTGGGAATLTATQAVLKVAGSPVMVGTLVGAPINGTTCAQRPPPASNKPCSSIVTQTVGASRVLKVNGSPVLLETSAGVTDGTPTNPWSTKNAGQAVLRAD
ncbi:MAG: hypothetical protein ACRERE_12480 [Candidatus Entotheonellia bacterium]